MNTGEREVSLRAAITFGAAALQPLMPWCDCIALLGALAEVESQFSAYNVPKYEKNYDWGGPYFNGDQRDRWLKWGSWAACSYSSWQMMFPTACELGFRGTPMDLCDDGVAVHFVVEFMKKRLLAKGFHQRLSDVADCWNSGSADDLMVPTEYIAKFTEAYRTVRSQRNL